MNPKYHLLVAAAALSLGGCTTDDTHTETVPENRGYKISFSIAEDSETRTTLAEGDILRWVPDDQVGIYTVGGNVNSNTMTVADVNQSPVEFIGVLENAVSRGDMFYAYYPYNAEQSTDPVRATLTIPAEQTQTAAGEYSGQSHPLVAVPMAIKWEHDSYAGRISSVRFRPLGAIVELQIFSSDEMFSDEEIRSVKFVSDNALAGDFTFNLTGVTVDNEPQIPRDQLTAVEVKTTLDEPASIPDSRDEAARVYLTITPGTYAGKFVVETDFARYTFRLSNAMNFTRAMIKGLPADLATAKCEVIDLDAAIPFADSGVKRICVRNRNWNTNGDGELSYREAAAVTEIGTQFSSNTTISSFNELRYFTGLKTIGAQAFAGCINMTSVKIPNDVTAIGDAAFWLCTGLTSIKIPDGVTTIGRLAFGSCANLTSITIPQTVTTLTAAFTGCQSLSAFYGKYSSDNNRCLIQDGTLLAFAPEGQTEYTIPDGVTTIGAAAFAFCLNLESIKIPNEVTSIGDSAFEDCSSLASINIPDQVTAIGECAFMGCSSLASIIIPDKVTVIEKNTFTSCSNLTEIKISEKVTTIRESAFRNCIKLESINIPKEVTTIEYSAFNNCSSLKSVYCKPTVPPALETYVFYKTQSEMKIYVPTASVDAYKTEENWNEYVFKIFADNN